MSVTRIYIEPRFRLCTVVVTTGLYVHGNHIPACNTFLIFPSFSIRNYKEETAEYYLHMSMMNVIIFNKFPCTPTHMCSCKTTNVFLDCHEHNELTVRRKNMYNVHFILKRRND